MDSDCTLGRMADMLGIEEDQAENIARELEYVGNHPISKDLDSVEEYKRKMEEKYKDPNREYMLEQQKFARKYSSEFRK